MTKNFKQRLAFAGTLILWGFAAMDWGHVLHLRSWAIGLLPGALERLDEVWKHAPDNHLILGENRVPIGTHYHRSPVGRFAHMLPAGIWATLSCLQVNTTLRRQRPAFHRRVGYVFFILSAAMMVGLVAIVRSRVGHYR